MQARGPLANELRMWSVPGLPRVAPGDDVGALLVQALHDATLEPAPGDVLVVCSKLFSRAHGRFVDLRQVRPGAVARRLADQIQKDPALVELILSESAGISRAAPGVLIVRHRLGFVSANAGIDASNARPLGAPANSGPWVLLLPPDPDADARALGAALRAAFAVEVGVVVSDSHGRPFRRGALGVALGVSGVPALLDGRGDVDLDGRVMEHTETALADSVAAAADLLAGQAAEGQPVTLIRGLQLSLDGAARAGDQYRAPAGDLYL